MRTVRSRRRSICAPKSSTPADGRRWSPAISQIHDAVIGLVAGRRRCGRAADAARQQCERVRAGRNRAALDRAHFDRHFAVNLRAPVFLAEAFAAQVPHSGGGDASIVNLLDQRVFKPTPRFLSYGLAKSALHAATTTLAQALAPRVRVNAVAPGPTLPNSAPGRRDLRAPVPRDAARSRPDARRRSPTPCCSSPPREA